MKRFLLIVGVLVLVQLSCRLPQFNPFKPLTEYPEPELKVDNTYFSDLGCFTSTDCLPDALISIDPPINSISEPSPLLGGLNPAWPLAVAQTFQMDESEIPSVYTKRCMAALSIRYLVNVDGEIRLIDSPEGMKALYAPIENEDEALSYALAVTGLEALYDLDLHPEYKRHTNPLVESHSTYDGEKFIVHLFDTFLCGCGPHIVTSVDVTVYPVGTFSLADPVEAFSDPATDGLCVD